jgi:glutathione synthase/RimK-type ligase-like ATP-grasp enzyme
MKKIVFLSCDDLSSYVVDDKYLYNVLKEEYPEILFDVVSWSAPDVNWTKYEFAVVRTTWDYTKRRDEFLAKMNQIHNSGCKVYNSPEILKWNSHKSYLKELQSSGVQIIESYFLDEETPITLNAKLNDNNKFVLKPIVGASADHIRILEKAELLRCISNLENPVDWFVQPFMEEVLEGERSIFFFNSKFSHAAKKVPKTGDFRVQEEHGGIITSYLPDTEELEFSNLALKSIKEKLLYARIDFLKTKTGPQLIELELIEPSLYFRTNKQAAYNFAEALKTLSGIKA